MPGSATKLFLLACLERTVFRAQLTIGPGQGTHLFLLGFRFTAGRAECLAEAGLGGQQPLLQLGLSHNDFRN